jgi:dihydropyrimidinase
MNEFVAITSSNAARIFNIYPRKGALAVGSDADIVVWDPSGSRTISAATHHSKVDFNIFEGMTVQGIPSHTLSRGRICYKEGELMAEEGYGKYIDRPAYAGYYDALKKLASNKELTPVARD